MDLGGWLSRHPFACVGGLALLAAIALAIAYAGTREDYRDLADAPLVAGTVARATPHVAYVDLAVDYPIRGGMRAMLHAYPRRGEAAAALQVGATADVLATVRGAVLASRIDALAPWPGFLPLAIVALLMCVPCVVLDRRWREDNARRSDPLDALFVAIARTRNVRAAGVPLFAGLFAPFLAVSAAMAAGESTPTSVMVAALALASVGVGAWLGWLAWRLRDPRRSPIAELIVNRPAEIASVHRAHRTRYGVRVENLVVCTAAGVRHALRVTGADADALTAEIVRRAPHVRRDG